MQRSDFRFFERLRVRWAEIDAQQIVFNGHYLTYFDTAIAGYWRALAMPYAETMARARRRPVRAQGDARIPGARPATTTCSTSACAAPASATRRSCSLGGAFRQEQLLVSGELVYVFADPHAQGVASRCRAALRELFESFEAGAADGRGARRLVARARGGGARDPQPRSSSTSSSIPAEMEWDDADADAVHAVAFNRLGRALGTGRMLEHVPGVAKIGRMAVAARVAARRRRPRRARRLARRGARSAAIARRCCTRRSAPRRSTSAPASCAAAPEFDEAGIAHVEMLRAL